VRRVGELAVQFFITNDRPNVAGLILAGSAEFKTELSDSDLFDPRLRAIVVKIVDVSYGGENGFNQAIELSQEALSNVKFVQEKKLIQQYFDLISQDTNRYCFGISDTFKALEQGAVETLIVWENLETMRYQVKNPQTGGARARSAFAAVRGGRGTLTGGWRLPAAAPGGHRGEGGHALQGAGGRGQAQGPGHGRRVRGARQAAAHGVARRELQAIRSGQPLR